MSQNFVFPPPPPPPPSTPASSIAFSPYSFQQSRGGRGHNNSYQGSRGHAGSSGPQYNTRPRYSNGVSGERFGRDGGQSSGHNGREGQNKSHWKHNHLKEEPQYDVLTANKARPNYSTHATESSRIPHWPHDSTMPGTSMSNMSNMFDGRAFSGDLIGGSPMRIGSKNGQSMLPDVHHHANGPLLNGHLPSSSFNSQRVGQKRIHSEASGASRTSLPRTLTAPAVPAFGTPLPSFSTAQSDNKQPTKKKRKHNQLGLTPRKEEHESSEEEDVDEESKLAAAQSEMISSSGLRFSYKGRHATLSNPAEIAAWIEERKRRYPTQARVAEAAERKRKLQEADRIAREERKAISTRKRMVSQDPPRQEWEKKSKKKQKDVPNEQSKAEKLRKDLEKAQRRLADFEAKTANAHAGMVQDSEQLDPARYKPPRIEAVDPRRDMIYNHDSMLDEAPATECRTLPCGGTLSHLTTPHEEVDNIVSALQPLDAKQHQLAETKSDPQASMSQQTTCTVDSCSSIMVSSITGPPVAEYPLATTEPRKLGIDEADDVVANGVDSSTSDTSTDSETDTESEDDTSSSGSSSSGSEPSESSMNCKVPSPLPLVRPSRSNAICHAFLKNGRCHRGDKCRYRHELPERGSGAKALNQEGKKKGAKLREEGKPSMSLYQRMLARQQEEENEIVLRYIISLGEQGLLDEPASEEKAILASSK